MTTKNIKLKDGKYTWGNWIITIENEDLKIESSDEHKWIAENQIFLKKKSNGWFDRYSTFTKNEITIYPTHDYEQID